MFAIFLNDSASMKFGDSIDQQELAKKRRFACGLQVADPTGAMLSMRSSCEFCLFW